MVAVDAATPEEAIDIAERRYRGEEIVLDSSDFADVEFTIKTEGDDDSGGVKQWTKI